MPESLSPHDEPFMRRALELAGQAKACGVTDATTSPHDHGPLEAVALNQVAHQDIRTLRDGRRR